MSTVEELKTQGNELYKAGQWKEAAAAYSKALAATPKEAKETTATILKNRAAAYLKTVRERERFISV